MQRVIVQKIDPSRLKRRYLVTIHKLIIRRAMRTPDILKKRHLFEHAQELEHALQKLEDVEELHDTMAWKEELKERLYDV